MICGRALQLFIDFEVGGGRAYYDKHLSRPTWPGYDSGVTIGIGFDLGHCALPEFLTAWTMLPDDDKMRLGAVVGYKRAAAKRAVPDLQDIIIPYDTALAVFRSHTLPLEEVKARATFPGCQQLPELAYGALVSLVYNRGMSLKGDRRLEMREIRAVLLNLWPAARKCETIAACIRAMKRHWIGTDIERGMARRREAEAELCDEAARIAAAVPA